MKKLLNQKGIIHTLPLLIIVAAVGIISFLLLSSTVPLAGLFGILNPKPASRAASSNCGLANAIFCDTFDAPARGNNRAGDLDGNVWGVSRTLGGVNSGQGEYFPAPATLLRGCNGNSIVRPPNDVIICNGQLRESTNDNPSGIYDAGAVTVLAMYPKQPFDFAGRTGIVAFDLSNDSHGNHAAWPEFWMSDKPVPVPFNHFDDWQSLPQHGFGIRFAGGGAPGQFGTCPTVTNTDRWTVDSAAVVRNYVMDDYYQGLNTRFGPPSAMKVQVLDCVIKPPDDSGIMNHVEIHVSQNQIDVYATDAGTTAPLKRIAVVTNANLTFSRGLIWLEDVHYNADKAVPVPPPFDLSRSQRQHTFVWDNVAFDGPFTYRDFSYDALDNNQPTFFSTWNIGTASGHNLNLGKLSGPNQSASWDVLNMPANPQAAAVRVLFNFIPDNTVTVLPTVLNVIVNEHAHPTTWPYPVNRLVTPAGDIATERTLAVTIPITDLVAGTNVVQLGADQIIGTANVSIVLVDVPGGVPVLPGSINSYPNSTAIPSTTSPSPTPTPSTSCPKGPLGDINCDGLINIFDYNILVGNFGKSGTGIPGDLNNDGVVNIFDYNILVGNFGK